MRERGGLIVSGLVILLLAFPLGYLVHVSPRFPGSLAGSLIGIVGGLLMLLPLLYLIVKRIPFLRTRVTRCVSMRTLLAIHIYAGVLGPILGVIHSAHKFRSPLGVSLTGMMLVVVASGFIGRYLLTQISTALQGRRSELAVLSGALDRATAQLVEQPSQVGADGTRTGWLSHLLTFRGQADRARARARREAVKLADAVADIEYTIRAEEIMRDLFTRWLKLHIVIAMILYGLLALHIWSGLYYGLRWL